MIYRNVLAATILSVFCFGSSLFAADQTQPQQNPLLVKPATPAPNTTAPATAPKTQLTLPATQGNLNSKPKLILLKPDDIAWKEGLPGLPKGSDSALLDGELQNTNVFTLRIRMPSGYQIPPHWHMIDEHITVISGTFHVGLGEKFDTKETIGLKTGSYFVVPARINYFSWASEDTVIQINNRGPWNIHYVFFKDDPRTGKR